MFKIISIRLYEWWASLILKSFKYYLQAKRYHESSPQGFFDYYHKLSPHTINLARKCSKLQKAILFYNKTIEEITNTKQFFNESIVRTQLGQLFHAQGKLGRAKKEYEEVLNILEGFPHPDTPNTIAVCYFRLAEIYWVENKKSKAYELLRKHKDIKKLLGNENGKRENDQLLSWFEAN